MVCPTWLRWSSLRTHRVSRRNIHTRGRRIRLRGDRRSFFVVCLGGPRRSALTGHEKRWPVPPVRIGRQVRHWQTSKNDDLPPYATIGFTPSPFRNLRDRSRNQTALSRLLCRARQRSRES